MRRRVLGIGIALVLLALVILLIALRSDRDPPRREGAATRSTPIKQAPPVPMLALDAAAQTDDVPALPQPTITAASNEVATGGTATITGRVINADGAPLTAYGLLVTKRTEPHYADDPIAVHDANGRFTFKSVKAGTWNLVIGAPRVARTIVANVAIADGKLTDVGTITVERGARIKGRVLDGTSHPVAGAKVALATSGLAIMSITTMDGRPIQNDALRDDVAGKHSTTTNAAGEYVLDGVAATSRMWIEASSGKLTVRHDVPAGDATIDLVLGAAGGIDGTLEDTAIRMVSARSGATHASATADAAGKFHFDALQPGDYIVFASDHRTGGLGPVHVTVPPNQRVAVTLAKPTIRVTLDVAVTGPCDLLGLYLPDAVPMIEHGFLAMDDEVASAHCTRGAATLEGAAPGTYRLCRMMGRECVAIEIAAEPVRQHVAVEFKP